MTLQLSGVLYVETVKMVKNARCSIGGCDNDKRNLTEIIFGTRPFVLLIWR
jgi:hypothetical protein